MRRLIFALAFLLTASLACSLFFPPAPTAPVPARETVALPTVTPAPLYQSVTLISGRYEESGQAPNFTITAMTPQLTGADDPRVQAFNSITKDLVDRVINEFKVSLTYQPAEPVVSGSFIDVTYEVLSPPGGILSLKINVLGYSDGAAHPYHYSQALTYDLEEGRELALADLFQPGADYLTPISNFCKTKLAKRDIAFEAFSTGADPAPENYRSWNLTAEGLLITFDEYQVAPYAAGAQTVVIPFAELAVLLDPSGPSAAFMK